MALLQKTKTMPTSRLDKGTLVVLPTDVLLFIESKLDDRDLQFFEDAFREVSLRDVGEDELERAAKEQEEADAEDYDFYGDEYDDEDGFDPYDDDRDDGDDLCGFDYDTPDYNDLEWRA